MSLSRRVGPVTAPFRPPRVAVFPLLLLALARPLLAQEPRAVSGVVVDAQSGEPVADVLVRVEATQLQAITDDEGRFRIEGVPVGSPRLVFRHLAYGEHAQTLRVADTGTLTFQVRISRQAIELAPVEVEVVSSPFGDRRASGNSIDLIDRETIEMAELRGESLLNVLGREVPGIRVRGVCVEYRLQAASGGIGLADPPPAGDPDPARYGQPDINYTCRGLGVYLDGIRVQESGTLLQTLPIEDLESIEVLSPGEAGVRYGAADRGVILLQTRRGVAPDAPTVAAIKMTGFDWDESVSYPWARVLGVSFVANAAAVGAAYASMLNCTDAVPRMGERETAQCSEMVAMSAGFLTGTAGGLLATWAGKTPRSRGRTFPSLAAGAVSAITGYMLFLRGENLESSGSRTAGIVMLSVGTPLVLTLTDRIFRQLR